MVNVGSVTDIPISPSQFSVGAVEKYWNFDRGKLDQKIKKLISSINISTFITTYIYGCDKYQ